MARQTVEKTTSVRRTTVTIKPKPRSELSDVRSANAKKQKRGANGRFV